MRMLTCKCLNVKVFTKTDIKNSIPFECGLKISGWIVMKCLNCQMVTHAKNAESDHLLVFSDLITDKDKIDELTRDANYSPMYKIVVEKPSTNLASNGGSATISNNIRSVLQSIQTSFEDYIAKEQTEMKKRIKAFEDEEHSKFDNLKTRYMQDKNKLINVLIHNDFSKSKNVNFFDEWVGDSPTTPPSVVYPAEKVKTSSPPIVSDKNKKHLLADKSEVTKVTAEFDAGSSRGVPSTIQPTNFSMFPMSDQKVKTDPANIFSAPLSSDDKGSARSKISSLDISVVDEASLPATSSSKSSSLASSSLAATYMTWNADNEIEYLLPKISHPAATNYSPILSPMSLEVPTSIPEEDEEDNNDNVTSTLRNVYMPVKLTTFDADENSDDVTAADTTKSLANPSKPQSIVNKDINAYLADNQNNQPIIVGSFEPEDDHEVKKPRRISRSKGEAEVDDSSSDASNVDDDEPVTQSGMYSMSVPISVPWPARQMSKPLDDAIDETPVDEQSMAAAIRAMARSVKVADDGSELFGELPTSSNAKNSRLSRLSKGNSSENEATLAIG
ncbi:hypothetical protein HELRODRAFT_162315 [Helobdella robusta]|uniref:Uncharacterized protein n=1 Tax=Helobdella robusta TaxID=6412 RepID=T1ESI1_HELRO|nr:hypothetical protein HELRODRAFT_162315 [Helobdella robusta]ESN98855.1 hypothetical protein HELRODRAFT_162315 [Helobdella robusta]